MQDDAIRLSLIFVFAILLICFVDNVLAADKKENQNLFNLVKTPFINNGKIAFFFIKF